MPVNREILVEQLKNILKRMEQDKQTIKRYIELFELEIIQTNFLEDVNKIENEVPEVEE